MKKIVGVTLSAVVLAGAVLTILSIWDIYNISWLVILKGIITILIVCAVSLLLWLINTIFFKKNPSERINNF